MTRQFPVVEKTIAELRVALEAGEVTAVELVDAYLARIAAYDEPGTPTALNSVVVRNPDARAEAEASDRRRAERRALGPLDGIPYTAKDSFMARGLSVAAGSPAFADLVAQRDAFSIERLREAGCVLLGLTNMPPMANGGMQRGVYGRAESPYSADYLTSAFGSGSSNGSGTATAASFAAFGLGEETWSSGRAPASCNALCAYTPRCMPPFAIGGMLVSPSRMQPAPRRRSIEKASRWATRCWNAGEPAATVRPFAMNESLAVYGMPSSGPSVRPSARRRSDAAASPRASGLWTTTALRAVSVPAASYASMRAR